MRRALLLAPLAGLTTVLAGGTAAVARNVQSVADCAFCAPEFVSMAPRFHVPAHRLEARGPETYPGSRYTRFDVEGVRLLTRMP